jgi:hypothetical protein
MDQITMNTAQILTSYGALGIVALYFMYKDMILNKALTDALNKFTVAINVMCSGKGVDE